VFDLIRRVPTVRDPERLVPVELSSVVEGDTIHSSRDPLHLRNPSSSDERSQSIAIANVSTGLINGFNENDSTSTDRWNNGMQQRQTSIQDYQPQDIPTTTMTMEKPIISAKNVTITYGSMDLPAVSQVSLDVYHGDRVAIVGRSGSGKSSMLRTMLRFYDPQSGSILYNGLDLRNMTRKEIASSISIVEQQPSIFPMTLLDNVLYGIRKDSVDLVTGDPCYSDNLRQAATFALAEAGLPLSTYTENVTKQVNDDGKEKQEDSNGNLHLDTRIGEGGRSLSGGQSQRLAIARTLVRNPQVILLDEPTAALDSQSEKKVILAIQNALKSSGECMVMVTHRLNVIRSLRVNRVVVMDQGTIVEMGAPEKLLKNKTSRYAKLASEQGILSDDASESTSTVDFELNKAIKLLKEPIAEDDDIFYEEFQNV
jgi:ABC-type multidrug transport system fused ATPase/permease subunit